MPDLKTFGIFERPLLAWTILQIVVDKRIFLSLIPRKIWIFDFNLVQTFVLALSNTVVVKNA